MLSLKRQAASGIKWTTTAAIGVNILQFVQLAILARLLSPHDFGLMAMIKVVIGLAQAFTDMGVSNAIIHKQNAGSEQLSSLYWANIFVGFIIFLIILAVRPFVVSLYNEPQLGGLIPWMAIIFLIVPFGQQFQVLLQKNLFFNRLAKIELFSAAAGLIVAVFSALLGYTILALIWGQLALATTKALLLMRLGWSAWRPILRFRVIDLKGFLSFGIFQMAERFLNYSYKNLDKLLIGKLLGAETLGIYSIAYNLMMRPLSSINPMITKVLFPIFSKVQDDNSRLNRGFLHMTRVISFFNIPIYLGMMVLAKPLIGVLLGKTWIPSAGILQILIILGIVYSICNPTGSLLLAKGRADIGFWMNFFALAAYTISIYIGSNWGLTGISYSLVLVAILLQFPIDLWIKWYLTKMQPLVFIGSFAPFLTLSILMALVITVFEWFIKFDSYIIDLIVFMPLGAAFYLSMVWFMKKAFVKDLARSALETA